MTDVCQLADAHENAWAWIVLDRAADCAVSPVLWSESEARAFADWYTRTDGWALPTVEARMAAFGVAVMEGVSS